ncbi:anti-sigma regulatory factor (Ser/Thr protein kinase) [Kineococcus xinjiangensis]|uniref:Anti-sigma regulatory factor (Ser/Thr protein kinase) n=1 Tax=Kineococcus xinjiangensis TaxID=512762 RepID=A0A2S6IJB4_9ACTN|nr:ATP-binding protein [Kineococcus xinjiangensis]PPK94276.1 anti-sigma regulatory factor (Ser/Thr protein kinase) [Kineococcus xinjiangensis]
MPKQPTAGTHVRAWTGVTVQELQLTAELASVPEARHWLSGRCAAAGLPLPARTVAELLTTELVGNAVVHGCGPVVLSADLDERGITVRVSDGHPSQPVLRHVGAEATGGRGVALVDMLSTSWGTDPAPDGRPGKTVWFHLAATSGWTPEPTGP